MIRSALYRGELVHARRDRFARRVFRYPAYVASIDPAELEALDRRLRLFSYNRPNVFALHDRDYEDGVHGTVGALAAHGIAAPDQVRLVTNLRIAHYVFNPVSFFLGYRDGALESVVAEVNNTYGGRYRYVLGNGAFRTPKAFFVSPFLHGPATYDFDLRAPLDGDRLDLRIHVLGPGGEQVLFTRMEGARVPLTDRTLAAAFVRYPLWTAQVIGRIHLEALRLRARGVPYRRPGPDHAVSPPIE